MSRREFVADGLRRKWMRLRHLNAVLTWWQLSHVEQRMWLEMADAGMEADDAYTHPE